MAPDGSKDAPKSRLDLRTMSNTSPSMGEESESYVALLQGRARPLEPVYSDEHELQDVLSDDRDLPPGSLAGRSTPAKSKYTREELYTLSSFESIDYFPSCSPVYAEWLRKQPFRMGVDRWVMMGCIGVSIGLVGYALYSVIDTLAEMKISVMRSQLERGDFHIFLGWLFSTSYSTLLVAIASALVVFVAPAAGGSGVPEVMAFLNGIHLPKVFNLKTLAVKFFSCALCVASGLPVGPEGPMVHMGAMLGAALSQGESTTLGCAMPCAEGEGFFSFKRFRNNKDKRDFVTAGVAGGVAVAFGAPVGGLLFAFEDVASFWQQSLGWQIFFCSMCGVFASSFFKSAEMSYNEGHFGLFDNEWNMPFEVKSKISTHALAIIPAVFLGLVCGALGALFTAINIKVARLRKKLVGTNTFRMIMEPCVIMVVMSTLFVVVPLFFGCVDTQCTLNEEHEVVCPDSFDARVRHVVEQSIQPYVCNATHINGTHAAASYNPLATIMHVTGEDAIKHLYSRGTHREFSYGSLLIFLVIYFLGAAYTSGSAISSGLFVPMLVIGATIGRIVGLGIVDLSASMGYGNAGVFPLTSEWGWIDPGVFALLGAGAFMAGVSRLSLSLAVILMEMSNEVHFLLPILISILVAKSLADAITVPLYHGLLEVKCIPYLKSELGHFNDSEMDVHTVHQIMQPTPIVTLHQIEKLSVIRYVLREHSHNGFPVVQSTHVGEVFVGIILRSHLTLGRDNTITEDQVMHLNVSYNDLEQRVVSHRSRQLIEGQEQMLLDAIDDDDQLHCETPPALQHAPSPHGGVNLPYMDPNQRLDLRPYVNTSAMRIQSSFSVLRTYILFRTLGLRHLTVVDNLNRVVGMVTRKNLLKHTLDTKLHRVAHS